MSSASDFSVLMLDTPFFTWLLRTRMSFYGHDLQLPWWFGLCCWNFAVAGFLMLGTEPQWVQQPQSLLGGRKFPYQGLALLLICLQAPLSFMADYVHMEHDSYWHAADRCLALPLMTCEVLKYILQCQQSLQAYYYQHHQYSVQNNNNAAMHPILCGSYGLAIFMAIYCFVQSAAAQQALDRDGFVYWHNAWHLYPLLASVITLTDFYVHQGWKRSTRQYLYRLELHILKRVE